MVESEGHGEIRLEPEKKFCVAIRVESTRLLSQPTWRYRRTPYNTDGLIWNLSNRLCEGDCLRGAEFEPQYASD